MSAVDSSATEGDSLSGQIGRLASLLASGHFNNADRAALKRYAAGQPPPLAFYRLWLRHLRAELPEAGWTRTWALLVWGLAFMGVRAHRRDRSLGRALAEAAYAEARLERLLAADEGIREDLFASLVRFMAAKGESFDWCDAALLLLTKDSDMRERCHRRIASDYYRYLPRPE